MSRLQVGIVFGGCSEEHPVSVKSAQEVARHLDLAKYEPHYIGITRRGAWKLCTGPDASWYGGGSRSAVLSPDRDVHGLLVFDAGRYELTRLDVLLPLLHGRLGEDGAIQGLFELSGIPYVGCDIQSSALCMDKSLAYLVVRSAGIAVPDHWTVVGDEDVDPRALTYPVFVKPARSGSSFGVSKVSGAVQLADALKAARQYDSKVLIEAAVAGREVGCAILGNGSDLIVGEVDHVDLSHGFFRIHQEATPETGSENSTVRVPADLPPDVRAQVQETAKRIYRALGCRGLSRVDMFLTEHDEVVLNEVNTLPGLTSYSRYPRMMAAAGLSLSDVIDLVVSKALEHSGAVRMSTVRTSTARMNRVS
ncbi:MAG TPA: D-alanine--(R)-lactate ligase [Mycobacteriales bacterium]|nr:D-alanine--(R)-lactate ligase [Mycobacteriales bacterium]